MKELWKKKSVKVALAVIIVLAAVIIAGVNVFGGQRRREYNEHIAMAEKYLLELDYEQAIVEYTLALEIEPKSVEILDALEETYLAYAQTYVDMEEYESAIGILERGYEQTGRESLQTRIEELTQLQEQKEEAERLLAEEKEAEEQQKKQEEEEERKRKEKEEQEQQEQESEEQEENEETSDSEQAETGDTATSYQTKAEGYVFDMFLAEFTAHAGDGWHVYDCRDIKTLSELSKKHNASQGPCSCLGAMNTSLLEETETQYRFLITIIHTNEQDWGVQHYFEVVIDKTNGQGSVENYYDEWITQCETDMTADGAIVPMGTLEGTKYYDDPYGYKGRTFDCSR